MILKSFEFQYDFDLDFQITTSKMIWILVLNHLYLGDLILKSTYDDFAHLCIYMLQSTLCNCIYIKILFSFVCLSKKMNSILFILLSY